MLAKLPSDPVYQGCHRSIVIKIEQFIRHRNAERFLSKVPKFEECEMIIDAVHDKRIRRKDLSRLNRPTMVFSCHPGDDQSHFLCYLLPGHLCTSMAELTAAVPARGGHWGTLATPICKPAPPQHVPLPELDAPRAGGPWRNGDSANRGAAT